METASVRRSGSRRPWPRADRADHQAAPIWMCLFATAGLLVTLFAAPFASPAAAAAGDRIRTTRPIPGQVLIPPDHALPRVPQSREALPLDTELTLPPAEAK